MTTLLEILFSHLAPHDCILCSSEGNVVCVACRYELIDEQQCRCPICELPSATYQTCDNCVHKTALDGLFVVGGHENELKQLVAMLKFNGACQAAHDIAPVMSSLLPYFDEQPLVTHIPTAYGRARQRGFDQAELVAKELAKYRSWPYLRLLRRVSDARQVGATRQTRKQQAVGMFETWDLSLSGKTVMIVDDVVTTAASIEAAATALRHVGAEHVFGVAIARQSLH